MPIGLAAAVLAVGGADGAMAAAIADSPPLWRGARGVRILCLAAADRPADRALLQRELCDRLRTAVARGAPVPVETIAIGDPAVLRPDAVTLLVHASLQPMHGGRVVAFTVRPYRVSAEPGDSLFGATPRAAALPVSGAGAAPLDAAIAATLDEILPWRAAAQGARPIG